MIYARPLLLVSTCLGFGGTMFRGRKHRPSLADELKPYAEFIAVCPEAGIGLPHGNSLHLVDTGGEERLIQRQTGTDFTTSMAEFSLRFFKHLRYPDGCILKALSPACGIRNVKIFKDADDEMPVKKGRGAFAAEVLRRFPDVLIEDEKRLADPKIREHFLTVIFTKASFRKTTMDGTKEALADFHDKNRLLLTAYSKTKYGMMDKLIKSDKSPAATMIQEYRLLLNICLKTAPRKTSHLKVLQEIFSMFAPSLSQKELDFFVSRMTLFEKGKLSLSAMRTLLYTYMFRLSNHTLEQQTYFAPYPEELSSTIW